MYIPIDLNTNLIQNYIMGTLMKILLILKIKKCLKYSKYLSWSYLKNIRTNRSLGILLVCIIYLNNLPLSFHSSTMINFQKLLIEFYWFNLINILKMLKIKAYQN